MSLYDDIKGLLPVVAGAGLGGALAGGQGAAAGGAAAAGSEIEQQALAGQQQQKLLSLMSLMEDRRMRQQERVQRDQEMAEFHQGMIQNRQDTIQQQAQQNRIMDGIRGAQLDEKTAHDKEMASLTAGMDSARIENMHDSLEIKAMVAGRQGSAQARYDTAVGQLTALTGSTEGEIRMALSHAGVSANGAVAIATRAQELRGKGPVSLDALTGMASKAKSQYGTILDNIGAAANDPKADAAKILGPVAYGNYLIAKAKLFGLPPKERQATEDKIRKFAAASIAPKDAGKDWEAPSMDDLATLIDPGATESGADETKPAPATKPAPTMTTAAAGPTKAGATGTSKSGKPIVFGKDGKWHYVSSPAT